MFAYANDREHAGAAILQRVDKPTPGTVRAKAAYDLLDFFGAENAAIRLFFSSASGSGQQVGRDTETLIGLAGHGRLKAPPGTMRPWQDLPAMLDALRRRSLHGKAMLRFR